jgi:hypothetical protein
MNFCRNLSFDDIELAVLDVVVSTGILEAEDIRIVGEAGVVLRSEEVRMDRLSSK